MSGFVYFITPEAIFHRRQDDEARLVKIGFTRGNPRARMRALQCGSPICLELFAYIDGSKALETAFHEAFADHRMIGEWFHVSLKLQDMLGYFDHGGDDPFVDREQVVAAMHDVVFARSSPYPDVSDLDYCRLVAPQHLSRFYPEAAR